MSYKPSIYACLAIDTEPTKTAASVSVVGGQIISGTVADTRTINQTYLQVDESDGAGGGEKQDIQYTFTGLTGHLTMCDFIGRYQGNAGHALWLYVWNYSGTPAWDRVTAASTDFAHSTTDYSLKFILPHGTEYVSGGTAKLRIYHNTAPSAAHNFYTDYISVTQETVALDTAGTTVQMSGFTLTASNQMTTNASAGSITIPAAGDYLHNSTISFSGLANSKITLDLVVDGTKAFTIWRRKLGSTGDVGSAASSAIRTFATGEVVTWDFSADINSCYVSIISMRCELIRIN